MILRTNEGIIWKGNVWISANATAKKKKNNKQSEWNGMEWKKNGLNACARADKMNSFVHFVLLCYSKLLNYGFHFNCANCHIMIQYRVAQ